MEVKDPCKLLSVCDDRVEGLLTDFCDERSEGVITWREDRERAFAGECIDEARCLYCGDEGCEVASPYR